MANFTPQEIEQFLQEFFDVVGTRQYTGARYVPLFGRKDEDTIDWDNSNPYEPLTIVLYQGNSYTSRQYVPTGVDIDDASYWANTGNYNAQVEQYKQEVLLFDNRIDNLEDAIPISNFNASNTVKKYIDDLDTASKTKIEALEATITSMGFIDASKYGYDGNNVPTKTYAELITLALSENRPLIFPRSFETSNTLIIPRNAVVIIAETLTYTGGNYAVEYEVNPANTIFIFNRIYITNNGNGIKLIQDSDSLNAFNNIIIGRFIETEASDSNNIGLNLNAKSRGIYENYIEIHKIYANGNCVQLISDSIANSFLGENKIYTSHLISRHAYSIYIVAEAGSRITGLDLGRTSFESSNEGIYLKANDTNSMIRDVTLTLRTQEVVGAGENKYTITANGALRNIYIETTAGIRIDKINVENTYSRPLIGLIIDGGILSPSSYRFAQKLQFIENDVIYYDDTYLQLNLVSTNIPYYTLNSYRIPKLIFVNVANGSAVANLDYMREDGIDTVYVSQNASNNSTVELKVKDQTIFDGHSLTDSGRSVYKVTLIHFDASDSTKTVVGVEKVA